MINQILFKTYRKLDDDKYKELLDKSMFVFDANVLLDLYRLPLTSSKDLMKILTHQQISERIWIPFQVFLEYLSNRRTIIGDQKQTFNKVKKLIEDNLCEIDNLFTSLNKQISELKLKNRHALIDPDEFIDDDFFKPSKDKLNEILKNLEEKEKEHIDVNDSDKIQMELLALLDGKIGEPLNDENFNDVTKNGENRYSAELPPGYKDAKKAGNHYFQTKAYPRKFGDLFLWFELINKINADNLTHIIFVTSDTKEDWWAEKNGKRLGPRVELLDEIYTKCKSLEIFHMYELYNFMERTKEHFGIKIDEESIKDSKDLLDQYITSSEAEVKQTIVKGIDNLLNRETFNPPIFSLHIYFNGQFKLAFKDVIVETFNLHGLMLKMPVEKFHSIMTNLAEPFIHPYSTVTVKYQGKIDKFFRLSLKIEKYSDKINRIFIDESIVMSQINSGLTNFGSFEIWESSTYIEIVLTIRELKVLNIVPEF